MKQRGDRQGWSFEGRGERALGRKDNQGAVRMAGNLKRRGEYRLQTQRNGQQGIR